MIRPLPRGIAFAVLFASLCIPHSADASWYLPRIEVGYGVADATPLADFTRFLADGPSGAPEERKMEYESSAQTRIRVFFDLHPELQFGWTRTMRSAAMVFSIDGVSLETDDPNPRTDQPVAVPDFDITADLFTFRWWPMTTRWNGIGPTVTLGAGRIAQEQDGDFAPDNQVRVFDWSGDDFALVAGVGLEGGWKHVRGGLGIDVVRWRYEAPSEDVEGNPVGDVVIPIDTVLSFEFTGRISVGF